VCGKDDPIVQSWRREVVNNRSGWPARRVCRLLTVSIAMGSAMLSARAQPPGVPANAASNPAVAATLPTAGLASETDGSRSILDPNIRPIDLGSVLRLAGVQNPQLLLARQRVLEAVAQRQFAAAQFLPTLNGGASYDSHTGNLQQSSGNILSTNRSSVYVGAGSFAIAAGTVAIPGVILAGNAAEGLFLYLASRQVVRQRAWASAAEQNQVLLRAAEAYCELLRAEGHRAIAEQIRDQAEEVARITAAYARTGEGRQADADRAATELARRRAELRRAEGRILTASAQLCRVLNLDPSIRLHPTDAFAVPMPVIPDPVPLCELIGIALMRRPELGERRAVIRETLLTLEGTRLLPFSPTVLLGFSSGGFGGGSNLVTPVFGNFGTRADFDAVAYWTLRNLGVGNLALINIARARVQASRFQELAMLDQIRDEVAEAYARTHARFAQIAENEDAVRSAVQGFALDLLRIRQAVPVDEAKQPRPIEVIDSLKLLAEAKDAYLDAIVDYNQAHFALYVATGQPPADALAQPVPVDGGTPIPTGSPAGAATTNPPATAPSPPSGVLPSPFAPRGAAPTGP
jgi:outer membrane protein TolC